jgi:hypothetical protein
MASVRDRGLTLGNAGISAEIGPKKPLLLKIGTFSGAKLRVGSFLKGHCLVWAGV